MVADWLQDATFGVNALLAGVPRDGGDPVPPALASVIDETRDQVAAREQLPKSGFPLLEVFAAGVEIPGDIGGPLLEGDLSVGIRYATKQVNSATAVRDARYTMRAVRRSLMQLNRNENEAARTRNSILLIYCVSLRQVPHFEKREDAWFVGGLVATYKARDVAPE